MTDLDCIVVGGGAAGLSAALVLGRARVRTALVDAGNQANLPAHGIGGLLGHDGRPPAELYGLGRKEIAAYPGVDLLDDTVVTATRTDDGFEVVLADGQQLRSRRLLLASGMTYRLPEIDGLAERWGGTAFHCPFCHGWEVRDRPLAVLDPDPTTAAHRVALLRRWSDDVTVVTSEPIDAHGAAVVVGRPVALEGDAPATTGVRLADGEVVPVEAVLVAVRLDQPNDLARQLGAATESTPLSDHMLTVDPMGGTSVPGLYAAGDVAVPMPSVASAVASGHRAAAGVVSTLLG